MAQHDYVIANGTGAAVRSDLNNALAAIVSQNSGATAPATTYAYQWWADTTTGLLKIRNAANNAWITLRELDGTLTIEDGTASSPGLAFADDLNTGIYSPSADQLGITTGGTVRLTTTTTGITSALPVDVPLGTASAPTVTFTGDLNTGIYSPGADQVSFTTGGTERLRIDSTGQIESVSLGTAAAPTYSFTTDPNTGIYSPGADQVAISTNGSNRLHITSDGKVGIGLNPSSGKLEIAGATDAAPVVIKGASTEGAYVDFYNNAASSNKFRIGQGYSSGSDNIAYLGNRANADMAFQTNTLERFRIDSSGRLLVGTSTARSVGGQNHLVQFESVNSSPFSGVSIVGNSNDNNGSYLILGKSRGTSAGSNTVVQNGDQVGGIFFAAADGNGINGSAGRITCEIDGTPGANDLPGRLVFSTTADGASSPTERMRIHANGGISTNGLTSEPTASNFGTFINRANNAGLIESYRNVDGATAVAVIGGTTGVALIRGDGDLENTNNRYTGLSDAKLKQNIEDASSQWDDIKAIQVRKYELIEYPDRKHIGVVAQELEQVCPGLVIDRVQNEETGETVKSVAYSVLYMKAVKALQEAMERIETLEAKVAALEAA